MFNLDAIKKKLLGLKKSKRSQRMRDTGRFHKDKNGNPLRWGKQGGFCKIYTLVEKPTRYTGEKLRQLRTERGVGNVRKILPIKRIKP